MAKRNPLIDELRAVQKKHGNFDSLELLIPDLNGILKGKRIRPCLLRRVDASYDLG